MAPPQDPYYKWAKQSFERMVESVLDHPDDYVGKTSTVSVRDNKRFLGIGWHRSHEESALWFGTTCILMESRQLGVPIAFSHRVEPLDFETYFIDEILKRSHKKPREVVDMLDAEMDRLRMAM